MKGKESHMAQYTKDVMKVIIFLQHLISAVYQRLISVYLKGKRIPITLTIDGEGSYTNMKEIVVDLPLEAIKRLSNSELAKILKFLCFHEASHIRFTSKPEYEACVKKIAELWEAEAKKKGFNVPYEVFRKVAWDIVNCLEDGRIENILVIILPGLRKIRAWYRLGDWQQHEIPDGAKTFDVVRNNILTISKCGLYCKGFEEKYPVGTLERDVVDECIDYITEFITSKTIAEGESAAVHIAEIISDVVIDALQNCSGVNDIPPELLKLIEEALKQSKNFNKSGNTEAPSNGPVIAVLTDDDDEDSDSKGPSQKPDLIIDLRTKKDRSENENKEKEDKGKGEGAESSENTEESDDSKSSETAEKSSGSEASEEDSEENGSSKSSESEKDEDSEENSSNCSNSKEDSSEEDDSSKSSESEKGEDSEGEPSDETNSEEETDSSCSTEDKSRTENVSEQKSSKETFDSLRKGSESFEKSIEQRLSQIAEDLSEDTSREVRQAQKSIEASEHVEEGNNTRLTGEDVDFLQKEGYLSNYYSNVPSSRIDCYRKVTAIPEICFRGSQTRNTVENILASQQDIDRVDVYSGELNEEALGKFVCGRADIFKIEGEPKETNIAVYIAKDDSGSMHGNKEVLACTALAEIEEVFKPIVPLKITTFTERRFDVIKDWDDRDSFNYSWSFHTSHSPGGGNDDALAIMNGAMQLLKRPEEKKLLIVISDGLPCCSPENVHKAVEWARKNGIFVISFFIGSKSEVDELLPSFRAMYSRYFCGVNPKILGSSLIKFLRSFIEE